MDRAESTTESFIASPVFSGLLRKLSAGIFVPRGLRLQAWPLCGALWPVLRPLLRPASQLPSSQCLPAVLHVPLPLPLLLLLWPLLLRVAAARVLSHGVAAAAAPAGNGKAQIPNEQIVLRWVHDEERGIRESLVLVVLPLPLL